MCSSRLRRRLSSKIPRVGRPLSISVARSLGQGLVCAPRAKRRLRSDNLGASFVVKMAAAAAAAAVVVGGGGGGGGGDDVVVAVFCVCPLREE